jgi:signal transduction histidine kinase
VNAAPVQTGLGDPIGTVAVFRDFTHEAEVEQMKNTFVAMVSHELRTPLNAILGYAEMMREAVYGVMNPPQSGVMERIETSSRRLLAMVSDLLDQAQLEAGRMKIFEADFMTSDLIDAVHGMMDKQFKDKKLALNIELDPAMPVTLRGDAHRLQQILLNLVGNAVKFTETGSVTVRVFREEPASWGMEVTDTGPGIPLEAQQYVFESFRQADNVTTRTHGGIGLGLAIVRSLVNVMGGKITLDSVVGEGSTFTVILPMLNS